MTKEKFHNLIKVLDKEISAYEKLKELFEEKKEVLKHAKSDELGTLDNQILAQNEAIVKLNKSRQKIAETLISKDAKMSQFIELAEMECPELKDELVSRKVKICKISEQLVLLNNQNVELIKHGIIITDKMLGTIIDAFAPQGSNYSRAGKTDTHDLDMWTINEEI
jgi:flagellar biosynthesis/type III secretory pathway chaperone